MQTGFCQHQNKHINKNKIINNNIKCVDISENTNNRLYKNLFRQNIRRNYGPNAGALSLHFGALSCKKGAFVKKGRFRYIADFSKNGSEYFE